MLKKDKLHKDYGLIYRDYKPAPVNLQTCVELFLSFLTLNAITLYIYLYSNFTEKNSAMLSFAYLLYVFTFYIILTKDTKKTVFAICENGIYAPILPLGKNRCFIPWEEVKTFWITGFAPNRDKLHIKKPYLFIELYNLDEYYKSLPWFFQEMFSREKNNHRSHLNINLLSLTCDQDEVLGSLEFYKKKYKKDRIRRIMAGAAAED
jgi:hypothetical protein